MDEGLCFDCGTHGHRVGDPECPQAARRNRVNAGQPVEAANNISQRQFRTLTSSIQAISDRLDTRDAEVEESVQEEAAPAAAQPAATTTTRQSAHTRLSGRRR